jgi:hypothetical protein
MWKFKPTVSNIWQDRIAFSNWEDLMRHQNMRIGQKPTLSRRIRLIETIILIYVKNTSKSWACKSGNRCEGWSHFLSSTMFSLRFLFYIDFLPCVILHIDGTFFFFRRFFSPPIWLSSRIHTLDHLCSGITEVNSIDSENPSHSEIWTPRPVKRRKTGTEWERISVPSSRSGELFGRVWRQLHDSFPNRGKMIFSEVKDGDKEEWSEIWKTRLMPVG